MAKNYESVIESIQIIIKNMDENLADCINVAENKIEGFYPEDLEENRKIIVELKQEIKDHREAIIALQMVASGKLRVI
jgi:hypothetical protein